MADEFEGTPGSLDTPIPGESRRQRRRRRRNRRRQNGEPLPGLYLAPHLVTTANLFFGFFAIVQAFAGKPDLAAGGIILAGVCDAIDGRIARLARTSSRFCISGRRRST